MASAEMTDPEEIPLFSYGTLRQENVQLATFGRRLEGRPDALAGFALSPMTITDPDVIAASGLEVHTIARPSGEAQLMRPALTSASSLPTNWNICFLPSSSSMVTAAPKRTSSGDCSLEFTTCARSNCAR